MLPLKNTEKYLKSFILIETEPEGPFLSVCLFVYLLFFLELF